MKTSPITLKQWRSPIVVANAGEYAQAEEILKKSQSTVTYAVQEYPPLQSPTSMRRTSVSWPQS